MLIATCFSNLCEAVRSAHETVSGKRATCRYETFYDDALHGVDALRTAGVAADGRSDVESDWVGCHSMIFHARCLLGSAEHPHLGHDGQRNDCSVAAAMFRNGQMGCCEQVLTDADICEVMSCERLGMFSCCSSRKMQLNSVERTQLATSRCCTGNNRPRHGRRH